MSDHFYLASRDYPPTAYRFGDSYCVATYNFYTKEYTETSEAPFKGINNESKTYVTHFNQEGMIEGLLDF